MPELLNELYIAAFTCAVGWFTAYLHKKIAAEKEEIALKKSQKQAVVFNEALNTMERITGTVVRQLEQTQAKELRSAVKDGSISRDELLALKDEAVQTVYKTLRKETKTALCEGLEDVKDFIAHTVESKILQMKAGK